MEPYDPWISGPESTKKRNRKLPVIFFRKRPCRHPNRNGVAFFLSEKNLASVKFVACNSGARNGRANFMGAWKNCVLPAGQPPCPEKFIVLRLFWGGGANFTFRGARIFQILEESQQVRLVLIQFHMFYSAVKPHVLHFAILRF